MTQEEEVQLREKIKELCRSLAALSFRRAALQSELQALSEEYLSQFKEKESLERQITKVKIFAAKKEPQLRSKVRPNKMERLVRNLTPIEVTKLLARMREEGEAR